MTVSLTQPRRRRPAICSASIGRAHRFLQLSGCTRSVNRELEDRARARVLAGIKGYVTNLRACPDGTPVTAEFVIGAYHQLLQIEKSFRMAKATCRPGPSTTTCATRSKPT
jgi:hypothetical protein